MSDDLLKILIPSSIFIVGWFVANYLSKNRELKLRNSERKLRRLENQINEFYGPIYLLRKQTKQAHSFYRNLMPKQKENVNSIDTPNMTEDHHFIHDEITDNYLIPLNNKILDIFRTKGHLLDQENIPKTIMPFLEHCYPFEIGHNIYMKRKLDEVLIEQGTFPDEFDTEIEGQLTRLKQQYKKELNIK